MSFDLLTIGSVVPLSRDERVNAAIAYLTHEGFHVTMPVEREAKLTCQSVALRLGVSGKTVSLRLNHPECPPFQGERSGTGRILWLRLNPAVESWIKLPKQKGAPLETRRTV